MSYRLDNAADSSMVPSFSKALLISLAIYLANVGVRYLVRLGAGDAPTTSHSGPPGAEFGTLLMLLAANLVATCGIVKVLVPTSFERALKVTLCGMTIVALIVVATYIVLIVATGVLRTVV